MSVKHWLDYQSTRWGVGGGLRKHLQLLLLKKFLNYTVESRDRVYIEQLLSKVTPTKCPTTPKFDQSTSISILANNSTRPSLHSLYLLPAAMPAQLPNAQPTVALVRDVSVTVTDGYLAALGLAFGSAVKIGYLVVAMLALQVLSTGTMALELQPLLPLVVVCCLPVPVCAFLALRQRRTFALQDAACRAENAGVDSVIAAVLNYQLVSAYDKRTEQVIGGGSSP